MTNVYTSHTVHLRAHLASLELQNLVFVNVGKFLQKLLVLLTLTNKNTIFSVDITLV